MHKEIFLIVMLSISLVGMTFVENSFADAGTQFHSTFGKHGISQPGSFLNPQSMAFDSENNLYITDLGNSRVQKFDSNGNFLFEWGSKGSIPGQFGHPTGIAISDESVFVVDNKNNNIQKFDLDGNFITYWGQYGKDSGSFNSPLGIITSQDNFVYVVDSGNARIQKFTLDGEFVDGFGRSSQRGGGFITPVDIAINSDKLYVTDSGQGTINIYTLDGQFLGRINDSVGGFTIDPKGIVFDAYDNFYISDSKNNRVIQYNEFGVTQTVFGHLGINDAEFQYPQDVAISNDGYLFVTDTSGHRIQKFSTSLSDEYSLQNSNETQISEYEDNLDLNVVNTLDSEKKSETIIPNDFKKPTIMVPDNIIIEASGSLTLVNIGDAMATDENGILSLAHNAPSSFPLGINTIIWTAIDGAGNMAIGSQIVTIQDTTPPSISPLNDISREAKSPTENLVDIDIPLVTDDVGVLSITNDAPEVFPLGETIVTWTATDVMGNISTITQSVFLIDSMSPRIAYLDDLTIEASSLNENLIELIIPDSYDDVGVLSITNDAPEVFPLGETIVTWTATDLSGNTSSISQIVSIIDTTIPVIKTSNTETEANIPNGSNMQLSLPIILDVQDMELTNDAPEVFPLGETIVTWTATDLSGNTASATQFISVVDTTAPSIIVPNDMQIEAESTFTKIQELGEIISEDFSEISSITNDAPEVFPLGETIVTWTATDLSGNTASATQIISVVDTILPEIMAPSDVRIEASDYAENIIELVGFRASDLVEISSITNDAPEVFPLGETIVTWAAVDISGNSSTDTQKVLVVDTTSPLLTIPSDIAIELETPVGTQIDLGTAFSNDIVDPQPKLTNDAPEVFPLGETIVTWTATDLSGNTASATQIISVVDTTAPSIITPKDVQIEATTIDTNIVEFGSAEASDLVEISSITNDAPEVFPLGETIVTWTTTDLSGNTASATQIISVVDTTAPVIQTLKPFSFEATSKSENIFVLPIIEYVDNTEISSITNDAPDSFEYGTTIVTWTVLDISGNLSISEQEVHVIDTTAPSITIPKDVQIEATTIDTNIVEFGSAEASDLVEISSITNDAPEVFPLGETIVTWTTTDLSGNTASATQFISVVDTTAPVIEKPQDITMDATSQNNNTVNLDTIDVIESISDVSITNDAPLYYNFGETIVTWTATDLSGNTASATQFISIVDTSAPILNTPQNVVIDAENVTNFVNIGLAVVEDIIDDSPKLTNDAPEVFPLGETIVTWTATDKFGNISSSSQIISVQACGNSPSYYNMIIGSEEDDLLTGTTLADLIFAKGGDDIISGSKGNDCILGGEGNDIIFGNEGDDHISGQGGNDIIKGHSGEDYIFGGFGFDVVDAGEDIDTCMIIDEQNNDIVIKCESNYSENNS